MSHGVGDVPPPQAGLATLPGLWQAIRGWRSWFVASVVCNVLTLVAQAGAAAGGAWAITTVFQGGGVADLLVPALLTLAAVALRAATAWLESWLSHDLAFRMLARVRLWVYDAVARLAPAGLARRRIGDLLTSSLADAEALEVYYAHSATYQLSAVIATPLLWLALAVISPPAALAVAPVLAAAVAITLRARRLSRDDGREARTALAELGAEVTENAGAIREIVGYGLVAQRHERLAAIDRRLQAAQARNARRAGGETAALGVVALVAAIAAAAAAAWQLGTGTLTPAAVPFVLVLASQTTAPLLLWASITRSYGTTAEAAARIGSLLQAPPPLRGHGDLDAPRPSDGTVRAQGVAFRWNSVDPEASGRLAVDGVSVTVRHGEHLAIAGRSGSGKSTFAQLIARFMDPVEGGIDVAGRPLPAYARAALPQVVSLLPQDVALFQDTIRDNLRLATDEPVEDEALWSALRTAQADGIVRQLPKGLDTVLGDNGRSLSGGERQRLALARSILHPAGVLVLDEAVSQLDVVHEHDVQEAMIAARADRTTLTIAHRLSTLLQADRILVLEEGRLVGDGRHADLLEGCEAYRRLVAPQLEALR